MKNSKLIILIILAATGCTKKAPQSLISRWDKKESASRPDFIQRKLASSTANTCMRDVFNVDVLKEEMLDLEKTFPKAQRISGTWKHLDLSSLPVPQANFLKEFGDKIGDLRSTSNTDYSDCQDVPCIINKVYGRQNNVAGYVHYIWYLKTNTYLAANNQIPKDKGPGRVDEEGSISAGEYAGKQVPLQNFLYKDDELYGFWRLSHMLKAPHTTISKLRSIHHIPRGEKFIASNLKTSCGLAYSQGWILLTDTCLWLSSSNPDSGYFYQSITHELSHQVDFQEGRGTQAFYRSHKSDYLSLIGMTEEEFMDEKNVLKKRWKLSEGAKIISDYAKNNPHESFAEDLAIFRVDGDKARQSITTEHFNFVSQNYYQSKSFEKEALINSFIAENRAETERAVLKAVTDCDANPYSPRSTFLKSTDFSSVISSSDLSCYSSGAEEISNLIRAKVLMEEPDGCNLIRDNSLKSSWSSSVKKLLVQSFAKYVDEIRKDPEYISRIKKFYANLEDTAIATSAYLNCYGQRDEENCFTTQLSKEAEAEAQTLRLPADLTSEMATLYSSHHSYRIIQNKAMKFYQNLVMANSEGLEQDSEEVWRSCANGTIDDSQTPRGKSFQLGNGYMVSSMYNCINETLPDAVKAFVRNIDLDGFKIQHPNEEVLLIKLAMPEMTNKLKSLYDENREKEKKEAVEFAFKDEGKTRSSIVSDLSWVRKGYKDSELVDACSKLAIRQIQFRPLYHLKNELFKDFISEVCSGLESTPEFKELRTKETLMDQLVDKSELVLTQIAMRTAKECLDKYPMGGFLNKVRYRFDREACLKENWANLENEAVRIMQQDQDVQKTQMKESDFRERFDSSRKKIQKDTISTNFGIF